MSAPSSTAAMKSFADASTSGSPNSSNARVRRHLSRNADSQSEGVPRSGRRNGSATITVVRGLGRDPRRMPQTLTLI
uniref:Uncharacterized protein n=1 Tax=Arundo donax TaxID=35708 RepID=A0A0A8YPL4_ARUDO